jgi:hypothetical protein
MKKLAVLAVFVLATTAAAQEQVTPEGPWPSYKGA